MNIKEVVEKLEKVFPIDDIARVGKILVGDAKKPESHKVAWDIVIGDPTGKRGTLKDTEVQGNDNTTDVKRKPDRIDYGTGG